MEGKDGGMDEESCQLYVLYGNWLGGCGGEMAA